MNTVGLIESTRVSSLQWFHIYVNPTLFMDPSVKKHQFRHWTIFSQISWGQRSGDHFEARNSLTLERFCTLFPTSRHSRLWKPKVGTGIEVFMITDPESDLNWLFEAENIWNSGCKLLRVLVSVATLQMFLFPSERTLETNDARRSCEELSAAVGSFHFWSAVSKSEETQNQ